MRASLFPLLVAILSVAWSLGCGSSAPFDYMPVTGKVTYDDGTPIPASGMVLQFEAQGVAPINGMHPRPATAGVNAEGEFKDATSYKYGDGLIPGKHKVALIYATDANGKFLVPVEYTHLGTTPLVIDTGDGVIEIKVPRP